MKVLALSAVIILLGLGAVRAWSQPARVGVPAAGGVALEQYLGELGQFFDCSFTIEEAYVKGSNLALLSARVAAKPDPKAKLEEQLDALRKDVPHLTFAASKTNPRIIHIVDDKDFHLLVKISIVVTLAAVGAVLMAYFEAHFASIFRERAAIKLEVQLFEHIQGQPYQFFKQHESGYIMSRLFNDASTTMEVVTSLTTFGRTIVWMLSGLILLPFSTSCSVYLLFVFFPSIYHYFGGLIGVLKRHLSQSRKKRPSPRVRCMNPWVEFMKPRHMVLKSIARAGMQRLLLRGDERC